jgi:hypothetical protein
LALLVVVPAAIGIPEHLIGRIELDDRRMGSHSSGIIGIPRALAVRVALLGLLAIGSLDLLGRGGG